jgi:hypothetical protein
MYKIPNSHHEWIKEMLKGINMVSILKAMNIDRTLVLTAWNFSPNHAVLLVKRLSYQLYPIHVKHNKLLLGQL